uniref:ATP synthase complex subunit 8 n=1 Tax=Nortia carinicollis TaxID=583456 RepID=A0A5B9RI01_9CUCU|nr:ATP synthase F0 subunit 8 [Nortia carinicollis]QEG58670.1 ATP synthase F0 subunit 8 [Nortia carinicollis]
MPQMAPLNWLTLFFFFILIFFMFNILNFYSFSYYQAQVNKKKNKFIFNWKW